VHDKYSATVAELDLAEELPDFDIPDAEDYQTPTEIFRRKHVELIPMNEEEAIEQMELLDHSFYMFMNSDTESTNVLYRREDGGYGILVPQ
jgi:putative sigma-54 modulation protein